MRPTIYLATLVCILLIDGVAAEDRTYTELNAAIDEVFAGIRVDRQPGCVAGVIHNGQYVHKAGYGLANLEYRIPITSRSAFRTGSLSKQFTAMAIAILAERGELDLDADVHKYLPELRDYGHEVTVRQMIHHLSGMGDYDPELFRKADGSEFRFGNEDYWTIEEFYKAVAKVPLIHEPGTQWEYSNLAYFLLSQVVERASGKSLRVFAGEEIFGPLGMKSSLFNDNVNQPVTNRTDGYRLMDDGTYEIYMTNLDWVGDGGVFTTLDDFLAWDRNFYANKLGKGGDDLMAMVTTPHPDAAVGGDGSIAGAMYAFGMQLGTAHGEPVIGHTGGWVGFSTMYQRYPDLSLSVVVFCNSTDVSGSELGDNVAAIAVSTIKNSGKD
ncbi:MAG: penicillin-binding protein [Gammaproteobacteria bacterium]|nr:MAG: penicillin-binding protein [Gammaproteobacteria bacterium]